MRYAVLSDIHGNLPALQAVLEQLGSVDAIWCLGDIVGYGADPSGCVDLLRKTAKVTVQGNHDLACATGEGLSCFNSDAARACRWTKDALSQPDRAYLASLPSLATPDGITLAHGSPSDPTWEYVASPRVAALCFGAFGTPMCMVGHTHVPAVFRQATDGRVSEIRPGESAVSLTGGRFIINPGSVGQPRDGNPAAAYAVLDTSAETVAFVRVRYPVTETQRRILAARLPARLATRLSYGA